MGNVLGKLTGTDWLFDDQGASKEPRNLSKRASQLTKAFDIAGPGIADVFGGQILPMEQSALGAAQAVMPGYAALQQGINVGDIAQGREAALGDIGAIAGLSKKIDPEYYNVRSQLAGGLGEMMQPGLTGGERTEIERSLNKSQAAGGTLGIPSGTETVGAASTFGEAARNRFAQALQMATAALPGLQSPLGQAPMTGKISTPKTTEVGMPNIGAQSANALGNTLGQVGQTQITGLEAKFNQPSNAEKMAGLMPDY